MQSPSSLATTSSRHHQIPHCTLLRLRAVAGRQFSTSTLSTATKSFRHLRRTIGLHGVTTGPSFHGSRRTWLENLCPFLVARGRRFNGSRQLGESHTSYAGDCDTEFHCRGMIKRGPIACSLIPSPVAPFRCATHDLAIRDGDVFISPQITGQGMRVVVPSWSLSFRRTSPFALMDLRADFESTISKLPSISLRMIVNLWILEEWVQAKRDW